MVSRILATTLVLTLSLGATLPARACTRRSDCCPACQRTRSNSLRPDCCPLADAEQGAASTQARELPVSTRDAVPPTNPALVATTLGAPLAIDLARVPGWLSTGPPTHLRI